MTKRINNIYVYEIKPSSITYTANDICKLLYSQELFMNSVKNLPHNLFGIHRNEISLLVSSIIGVNN